MWAEGYEGKAVAAPNGAMYDAYRPPAIESVQRALISRGVYKGPVNGVLDLPTMKAIYAFQDATATLQVCGVPTPRTRKLLAQGSHTDPNPGR